VYHPKGSYTVLLLTLKKEIRMSMNRQALIIVFTLALVTTVQAGVITTSSMIERMVDMQALTKFPHPEF
jgi:hypothetical protein